MRSEAAFVSENYQTLGSGEGTHAGGHKNPLVITGAWHKSLDGSLARAAFYSAITHINFQGMHIVGGWQGQAAMLGVGNTPSIPIVIRLGIV